MDKQIKDLVEEGESSIEISGVSAQSFIAGDKKKDNVAVLEIAGAKSIAQGVKEKRDLNTDICETDVSNGNNSDAVSVITIDSSNSQEDIDHNVMTEVMYIVYKEDIIKLAKEKFEKYLERHHMLQDVAKRFIYNIWSNIVQVEVPDKYVNLTFQTITTADDDESSDISSPSNQGIVKLVAYGSDSDNADSDRDDFETPNSEPPSPKPISASLSLLSAMANGNRRKQLILIMMYTLI